MKAEEKWKGRITEGKKRGEEEIIEMKSSGLKLTT